jgi:Tol biopolymer transport system component
VESPTATHGPGSQAPGDEPASTDAPAEGITTSGAAAEEPTRAAPRLRRIAFYAGLDDKGGVFVVHEDGSGLREISLSDHAQSPSWSPDGSLIALADTEPSSEYNGIYVVRPDGTQRRRLAVYGYDPAWSPDGRRIAFTRYADQVTSSADIVSIRPDGSGLVEIAASPLSEDQVAWSPDGRRVAFIRDSREIRVADATGGDARTVTPPSVRTTSTPAWSPDGSHIAFVGGAPDLEPGWLYVVGSEGTDLRRLAKAHSMAGGPPAWARTGRSIAFRYAFDRFGIGVIDIDGKNFRKITPRGEWNSFFDDSPSWSPDNDLIAFERSSNQGTGPGSLHEDIWVARPDGSGLRLVAHVDAPAAEPVWEPEH